MALALHLTRAAMKAQSDPYRATGEASGRPADQPGIGDQECRSPGVGDGTQPQAADLIGTNGGPGVEAS
jgi:hypothetical protein